MNQELLINMFYAAPELWYFLGCVFIALVTLILYLVIKILKLKQKNYFSNRAKDTYAETLFATKDGYFSFIHPDNKVKDPIIEITEKCSKRLAVLLDLENGVKSTFENVMNAFYKDDAKKIVKYVERLREEGVSFEDEFTVKLNNKHVRVYGSKITGIDGSVYSDTIWFRNITDENLNIIELKNERDNLIKKISQFENIIDNTTNPIWLRDEKLDIVITNKKYNELINYRKSDNEIKDNNGENVAKKLALLAVVANKPKSDKFNLIVNGQAKIFNVIECPFFSEQNLEKTSTVGTIVDISELEEIKRSLRFNQESQLEILGSIGNTAFAVFDKDSKLSFYNKSFEKMWSLEKIYLSSCPTYASFLDNIREKRMLPEVSNFINYKQEEVENLRKIMEPKEDMLHLPDGRTIRRVRAAYPTGGTIFAFEDVSDKLATKRAYNSLLSIQKEVIDNVFNAVLLFDSNGKLSNFNKAYIDLWKVREDLLSASTSIFDIIDNQKAFFSHIKDWAKFKDEIINHLTNATTKSFILTRKDDISVDVTSQILSDGSIMVTYREIK